SPADALTCARPSIWPRKPATDTTPRSRLSTSASAPRANRTRSPSSPASARCSPSSTPSSGAKNPSTQTSQHPKQHGCYTTPSATWRVELAGEVLDPAPDPLVFKDRLEVRRLEPLDGLEGGGRIPHQVPELV